MPKRYDAEKEEPRIQKFWEDEKIFAFDKDSDTEVYSIDTPPPTVSGKMHLGHAFSYAQQDFVARYKRMRGFNVFYPFGTDDNGLPTKLLIEKTKNVKAADIDRKEFVKLCLETLEKELRPAYMADWKRIGTSCDFSIFYTTINEHCQRISQRSFIDLLEKGREYRAEAPAMFCPKCQTAISQVETEDAELSSFFNDVVFKADGEDLVIATTRPELLPACVGIFYHPDDKRYQHLKGKKAKVPLFDFEVPIMEDEKADPEKGTGIVMCCTFGDATDAEWQKAHQLPIKKAITNDGKMTGLAGKYEGMSIETARKMMIEDMKDQRLLLSQEPIRHAVNVHERCGTPIEFIHSKQWFIKYLDLKKDMKRWGKELNWFPEHMKNRYDNWVEGLQWDWCISRQLPFGIPFPVWYCKKCDNVIVAREDDLPVDPTVDKPPVDKCPECGGIEFEGEIDILNTWATSSLTPTIAKDLLKGTKAYTRLKDKPMNLRPQAHDIITFWLFNTVVKSQLHWNMNPWHDCMISGWALDPKGKKMSKSKGNVIEPQEMIKKYNADALRFWAAGSKLGEDLPFQEKDLVTAQKFMTKLWNASRFAFMHLEDYRSAKPKKLEIMDRWLLAKLNRLIKASTESFDRYEYSRTKMDTEIFFWQVFCDNYLEIVKDRLYNPDKRGKEARLSGQYALYQTLLTILKLMAPFTSFITEAIYQGYFSKMEGMKSIHLSSWPENLKERDDEKAEKAGDDAVAIIAATRRFKSDADKPLNTPIKKLTIECKDQKALEEALDEIKGATKAEAIEFGKGDVECNEEVKIKVEL
ncbi:valine--tRNA ligase [Candidatus Woesearchaeota archaeon]|nr:valine--tRNA ligase [Candidatus Woesearchaeota archaeon]